VCVNNLKQIGLALRNYRDAYGCFPPAYVADENGRPMHSWRVLILPWLEQQEVYNQYRFDEPWDGPNNRKLHDLIVSAYSCPSHPGPRCSTSYVAVVGPGTAWRGAASSRLEDVKDDPNRTILLVEVSGPSFHWMEPRDLEFDRMSLEINGSNNASGLSSAHPGGANVLLHDGAVRFLPGKTAPETLRALLTVAGGDEVGEF
jgi:prepilin-type processing-associated H-X9-DG protein